MKILSPHRLGYTIVEMMVASALAMVVLGSIASLAAWNFRERANHFARQIAMESADNVLEAARALPWDQLTPEWAKSRQVAEDPSLPDGKLAVTIADESGEKGLKRVVVTVSWSIAADRPRLDVELVGFFADRSLPSKGGAK
jgi:hypothetical protein